MVPNWIPAPPSIPNVQDFRPFRAPNGYLSVRQRFLRPFQSGWFQSGVPCSDAKPKASAEREKMAVCSLPAFFIHTYRPFPIMYSLHTNSGGHAAARTGTDRHAQARTSRTSRTEPTKPRFQKYQRISVTSASLGVPATGTPDHTRMMMTGWGVKILFTPTKSLLQAVP